MLIIKVLDILAAIIGIVALNLVSKSHKWWLVHAGGSLLFTIVMAYNLLPGMAIMGILLCVTGIKNYKLGEAKNKLKEV